MADIINFKDKSNKDKKTESTETTAVNDDLVELLAGLHHAAATGEITDFIGVVTYPDESTSSTWVAGINLRAAHSNARLLQRELEDMLIGDS